MFVSKEDNFELKQHVTLDKDGNAWIHLHLDESENGLMFKIFLDRDDRLKRISDPYIEQNLKNREDVLIDESKYLLFSPGSIRVRESFSAGKKDFLEKLKQKTTN